ncbi:putative ras-responsive element-binding protein 1 [Apostichopus japonicus]|uniref:Putative ras-responsive element-binding protein 1 n=1 Tax=Stichopus japonicus TaxID=307972 RepID=A0A2G8JET8_STIJA|nr:putative ras-responsive element-binding protein 1 [Apostichopus japonicus]
MCSAAFTQSSSLDEHMIKRHCEEEDSDQREIKSGVTPMQLKLINRDHSHISILKNCLQRKEEEGTMGENLRETDVVDSSNTETSASSHQSDSNVDLSSISKSLPATDSNKFQHFMSPQVNRQNFADQPPSQLNKNVEMSIDADGAEDVMINQERKLVIDTSKADSENVHGDHQHQIKEEPYECPHCGATFSTKSNCERHINRRHQGQKEGEVEVSDLQKDPFKCKECRELAFSTRRKLQKHYKDDHPLVPFPKEYMEAPDVIVNNKDLIEKIQQGYDPVLSSSVSGIIPEGTKKRNQLFFGSQSQVDREPIDQLLEEKNNEDSSSVHTNNSYMDQGGDELMEPVSYHESESAFPETGGTSPFLVKVENGLNGYSTLIEKRELLPGTPLKMDKEPGSLPSDEAFSDRNISEDDGCENSDSDSHVSTAAGDGQMMLSMVGDLSGAASLVIPQVTLSGKKGKKGARFSCDQCCKKFKSELTLFRHLKVHQLEHPFNCTECSATFTTKFNCQRHIMKLHGKRKEDVMSITGCGKVSEPGVQKAPSSSSNPPKQVTIDPSSSQVLFSYSTNVGLAPAVVKILPKKPLNDHVITPSKKISKQKIKNILPKLGSSKAKRQGHIDHSSSVSQLLTPYQNNVHFSNGQLFIKEELDASSEDAGVDGKPVDGSWNYSSIQSSASDDTGMVVEGDMTGCNSDIIKDLLGIQDSSTMDQILESADSAAKILGVQG